MRKAQQKLWYIIKGVCSPMTNVCWINLEKTQTSLFYFIIF